LGIIIVDFDATCQLLIIYFAFFKCLRKNGNKMKLTLREGPRLRVLENRVLRRIFGPRRDKVTGEWRKVYNEELSDVYCSPNIIWVINSRRMSWAEHIARMGERKCVYRVLVAKPGGRPWCRWEDNIEIDLQEAGCGGMDLIDVA
jgi:hypothetical protein